MKWWMIIALLAVICVWPSMSYAQRPYLFGFVEFRRASFAPLPQWQRIVQTLDVQQKTFAACDDEIDACASPRMAAWRAKLAAQKGLSKHEQLHAVNLYINTWEYKYDDALWGQEDYWATPLEFLERSGDCEDFAIFKYVSLKALGFDTENLRVVVVQDPTRNVSHAVLAVYLEDEIYILDNLYNRVRRHNVVHQYVPQYAVNEQHRWVYFPRRAS